MSLPSINYDARCLAIREFDVPLSVIFIFQIEIENINHLKKKHDYKSGSITPWYILVTIYIDIHFIMVRVNSCQIQSNLIK